MMVTLQYMHEERFTEARKKLETLEIRGKIVTIQLIEFA